MKKAWQREYELLCTAKPAVFTGEEQGWSGADIPAAAADEELKIRWFSRVPGSGAPEHVIFGAIQSMENMGYDVSEAEHIAEQGLLLYQENRLSELHGLTARLWNVLMNSPKITHHPYHQYTVYQSFEQYAAAVKLPAPYFKTLPGNYRGKTYQGWIGQICGGALGTALEGYSPENIRSAFGEVRGYVRTPDTYNDDITYELALLEAVKEKGREVTSADIALKWISLIPIGWSAEDIALKNLRLGIFPPESGYLHNPYREWIGAQMRGAVCGMLYPGDVFRTARLAWVDGQISHHNNGILGEVFNALLCSMAYVTRDMRKLIEDTAEMIPGDSEYRAVLEFSLEQCRNSSNWEQAWAACRERLKQYNWIHAYPNAAAEIIALWFSEGDYNETLHISAMEGLDADCNAAQAGTVAAIMSDTPPDPHWTEPIGDVLQTYMRGRKTLGIKELSAETCRLGESLF